MGICVTVLRLVKAKKGNFLTSWTKLIVIFEAHCTCQGGKTAVIKHIFVDALKFQLTSTKANNLLQNYGPALFKDLMRPILFVP